MTALLTLRGLGAAYAGQTPVLKAIDLTIPQAGIVALLGANGAGKTTLIRAISGLMRFHGGAVIAGSAMLEATEITRLGADRIVRLGLGQVPEGRMVFKHLTVDENLRVGGAVLPARRAAERIAAVYDLFPRLAERRPQAAGLMSGGEQQMLALGRALASAPRLLLIDELSLGLAPMIVKAIYAQLLAIRAAFGTAMLVVEQNANLALAVCDTAHVLERGAIVLSGTAAEVAASEKVRESYLGAAR